MRKIVVSILASAASVAVMAGCAQPTAQDSSTLAARADAWQEGLNAGDLDAMAALYSQDSRFMPPNLPMGTGHEAVRRDLQGLLDAGLKGDLQSVETMVAGDLGYRVGTYTLTTPDGAVADQGKFMEIWRLVDGEWKITNDIYNSDRPAGPAGTYAMSSHKVGDADTWLAAWRGDARRQQFEKHGAPSVRFFQDPENPSMAGLLIDVVDMEAFQAFLASEEGAKAKAEDTVIDKGMRILVEVTE